MQKTCCFGIDINITCYLIVVQLCYDIATLSVYLHVPKDPVLVVWSSRESSTVNNQAGKIFGILQMHAYTVSL